MHASTTSLGRAALFCAPLLSLLMAPGAARAQETPVDGQSTPPTAMGSSPANAGEPVPGGPPSADPEKGEAVGPVERLPPTAYPEWTTRGIPGGSLWFSGNMHGMPWPYYPKTGIGVSGYAWLDTGYESISRGNATEPNLKYLVSQGRAVLRLTPTYSSGSFYVQGQTELVGNKDQTIAQPNVADVDDLWVRVGQWKQWDLEVGRFEAYEVYHFGMAMDLNTLERDGASDSRGSPDVYGLKEISYRQNGIGNVALHLYPARFLRLELLGQFGFDGANSIDTVGGRPAIVFDLGWLKLKTEGNYRKQFPVFSTSKESRRQWGNSTSAQMVLAQKVEFGVNFAYGLIDHWKPTNTTEPNAVLGDYDTAGSVTDTDFGGFINGLLAEGVVAGVGANYNMEKDQQQGKFTHLQTFAAVQYLIGKQLFVKVVGSYAKAHLAPGGATAWDNTMFSGRIRLMYLF